MANIWVSSVDGDNGNAGTYDAPKANLFGAAAIASAGDNIYIEYLSNSAYAATTIILLPDKVKVISVDTWDREAVSEPSPVYRKGATESCEGGTTGSVETRQGGDFMGVIFKPGTGAGHIQIAVSPSHNCHNTFTDCDFICLGSYSIYLGPSYRNGFHYIEFKDCNFYLGNHSNSRLRINGNVRIISGALLGYSTPATAITREGYTGPDCFIENFDASIFGAGKYLLDMSSTATKRTFFKNCIIGSGCTLTTGTPLSGAAEAEFVNVASGATNYDYRFQNFTGSIYSETIIVNGASVSRRMVSTALADYFKPLILEGLFIYNPDTGSEKTVTVELVTDNVTLTDKDIWLEVEYLSSASYPLGSVVHTRPDIFATGTNLTVSSVGWTTTGLSTPVKQKLTASFTPQMAGPVKVRVCLAKASTTVYVDPKITIS